MVRKEIKKSLLKEENELIKTQEVCKSSIFILKAELEKIFNDLKKLGIAKNWTLKVQTYNQGYNLYVDLKYNYEDLKNLKEEDGNKIYRIISISNLYIQPKTFFDSEIFEPQGTKIEFSLLPDLSNKNKYLYSNFAIKSKDDIKKFILFYKKQLSEQIKEYKKFIEELS